VVDLTGRPLVYSQRMFETVNDCTRGEAVRLCRRSCADNTDTEAVAPHETHPGSLCGVGWLV
jgi:hypothetical protein